MQAKKQIHKEPVARVVTGLFSKKEAAGRIAAGCRHLHSSTLGERDLLAAVTERAIDAGKPAAYPWELEKGAVTIPIASSADRHHAIRRIEAESGRGAGSSHQQMTLESVLEELISNAVYHAYHRPDGSPKYARSKPAHLAESERIEVRFRANDAGLYVAVADRGGRLTFDSLAGAFARCYGSAERQIENKEGGAGLGLYMVFESATHIKITVRPGKSTEIGCWLADGRVDRDQFSFNFFEWR